MNLKNVVREHNVLNIIAYLRKSRQDIEREKRTGEDTLAEQEELMNRVLMGIELPFEMKMEIGSGENIDGRPVFKEVLKDLESKKYQAIAVKELSRLSRGNYSDAGLIIQTITENRLVIITPYKVYDPRNPMDMKQIRFELFLAREEYEMIKERMVGARYTYASQGKWVSGAAPFGYLYNKRTQKLVIDEEQAKTVRLIYDLFMNGLNGQEVSYQAIATHLSNLGIKTPRGKKNWSYFQVKKILTNDLYKGVVRFRTHERNKKGQRLPRPESEHIIVEDAHEPIIDKDYWEKVARKIENKAPLPHNPLDFAPNELASVCSCAICGGKLIRNCQRVKYKKKDGTESIYVKEFLKCLKENCMSVKYRDVEENLLKYMLYLKGLDDNKLLEVVEDLRINKQLDDNSMTRDQMLKQIEHKEKELKERMNFIYEQFETKIYTPEMFLERKTAIENELNSLEKSRKEINKVESKKSNVNLDKLRYKLGNLVETYNNLQKKEDKNKLLRMVFIDVAVLVTKKGRGRTPSQFEIAPKLRYNLIETLE
ncbi:recombinase family protein [Bacillus sp. 7586-K]|nr:recombinase family protein [Bacillus sp. 7586-K]